MDNKSVKILIVDDEEDIAYTSRDILEWEGFTVLAALNGFTALEIFKKEHPQIAIIDIHLGYSTIDGIELIKRIKKNDHDVECIVVTRISDEKIKSEAAKLGVKRYLTKPVDTDQWFNEVMEAVNTLKGREVLHG